MFMDVNCNTINLKKRICNNIKQTIKFPKCNNCKFQKFCINFFLFLKKLFQFECNKLMFAFWFDLFAIIFNNITIFDYFSH